ncbi:uncharacterized protein SAPINGB_P001770 [Magnusiomyces paraingens]|uniref:Ribosome biogenesis protein NSA1 n=1 Tax=Magnusiomyces paraingens TaxID=2606893 RepID=A0A5E8BI57_9ASCO|nr:uncharacterized protein SAPINGB_P001770 [Saprochaete ingens]VVT48420.1 unnamed protein product [Saprochaete ingens]
MTNKEARHTKCDEIAKRHAVWISDLQFLDIDRPFQSSKDGLRIAVSTRYGEILLYETQISYHPIIQVLASFYPLIQLWFGGNEKELLFSDTQFNVGVFDSVTGKSKLILTGESSSRILSMSANYLPHKSGRDGTRNTKRSLSNNSQPKTETFSETSHQNIFGTLRNQAFPFHSEEADIQSVELRDLGIQASGLLNTTITTLQTNNHSNSQLVSERSQHQSLTSTSTLVTRNIHGDLCNNASETDSASITPDMVITNNEGNNIIESQPILLATGGLDSYLRIFDSETGQMTSKINIDSKISKVLIIDPNPIENKDLLGDFKTDQIKLENYTFKRKKDALDIETVKSKKMKTKNETAH